MTALVASPAFTLLHVAISLAGIAAGLAVLAGLIRNQPLGGANTVFLATTVAATLTGFLFPIHGFDPALGVGIAATLVLALALLSLYRFHLHGPWRPAYVATATAALYLNVFVGIVQAFEKIPALHGGGPAIPAPPPSLAFIVVQALTLIGLTLAGAVATRRFHPAAAAPPRPA